MSIHINKFTIYLMTLIPFISFSQTDQIQKVKVTIHHITCNGLDDAGNTEELYGRIWALILAPYRSVEYARIYFNNNEIFKIGQGGGKLWKRDRTNSLHTTQEYPYSNKFFAIKLGKSSSWVT